MPSANRSGRAAWRPAGLWLAPLAFWLAFYAWPLVDLARLAWGDFDLAGGGGKFAAASFRFTLWQALWSAAISLALAWPGALVLGSHSFAGRDFFLKACLIPFVLPTIVIGGMFKSLSSWPLLSGLVEPGVPAILTAHVYYNYPLALVTLTLARERLNPDLADAARTLGAGRLQVWRHLTRPLMRPAVRGALLMIFIMCFLSFGTALVLGTTATATVEVAIYRAALYDLDFALAGLMMAGQLLTVLAVAALLGLGRKESRPGRDRPEAALPPARGGRRLILRATVALISLLLAGPPLMMLWSSVASPEGPSLVYWRSAFTPGDRLFDPEALAALARSVRVALLAAVITATLALGSAAALARLKGAARPVAEGLLLLPWATSAVGLGLALSFFFGSWPAFWRDGDLPLALTHSLVAWPLAVRLLRPTLAAWPLEMIEAARTLGASPARVWRHVILPWLARPLAVAATVSALVSLGEFGASTFMARGGTPTLPLAMSRYLSLPGDLNHGRAMVMGSLMLMVILAGSALAMAWGWRPGMREGGRR